MVRYGVVLVIIFLCEGTKTFYKTQVLQIGSFPSVWHSQIIDKFKHQTQFAM